MPPKQAQNRLVFVCSNEACEKREFEQEGWIRAHLYHLAETDYSARRVVGQNPPCQGPGQDEVDQFYRFPYSVNECGEIECAHIGHTPTHLKAHRNLHDSGLMDDPEHKKGINFAPILCPCQTAPIAEGQVPCCDDTNFYIWIQAQSDTGAAGFPAVIGTKEEIVDEHMAECHPELPGDLECSYAGCGETFHTQKSFVTHANATHRGVVFKCPFPNCGVEWKTAEMTKDPMGLAEKVFIHIKYEHTDVQCPHCDYSVKGDKQARSNMMNDHLSYKNLVEDDEFSNLHGLTEEDRQRCVDTPGEYTFFADELWAQAVVTALSGTMGFAQKLANLCDPIRIYRDYKDGYKSVKVLSDAIEGNTGRYTYRDSKGNVIVPDHQGRRRVQVQPAIIEQENVDAALDDNNEQQHQDDDSSSSSNNSNASNTSS